MANEGVWASDHKASFFSKDTPDVARDEVDDLIQAHLDLKDEPTDDEEESLGSVETETEEEAKERERKETLLKKGYQDYEEFGNEQSKHKSLAEIILDKAQDKLARDHLKDRATALFNFSHPSQRIITENLPKLYKPIYSKPLKVELGDPNAAGSYYISTESYVGDNIPLSKFEKSEFTIYTIRDTTKHRVWSVFCLSPRGPNYCPKGAPCIEAPWWETKGGESKTIKKVDGSGKIVDVVIEGEKKSMTGKLCVRMPGEHVLIFWDYRLASEFVRNTNPLYFNKKSMR
ncbi:hypothetical protein TrST_g3109 [Triparma strigata]|uniref:Uncharacterized protein n=1 Tax=Triparma strigata TaxID=1606541 RepID=A0A9W7BBT3_9STRA|nr:hypothetical protein TrST_g3109 [Triparma strigata]